MATAVQVYETVNALYSQATGTAVLAPTEANFIMIGQKVLASDDLQDTFFGVLWDAIAYTDIAIREYRPSTWLKKTGFDYGVIYRRISYALPVATKNPSWQAASANYADPFEKSVTEIVQELYNEIATWEVDATVKTGDALKTAFNNAESMAAFIGGYMLATLNAMAMAEENLENLCRGAFIARRSVAGKPTNYRNLLAEYNSATNSTLTVNAALTNPDFLRFASMELSLATDYMTKNSKLFNNGDVDRHTPKDSQVLTVLSRFEKAAQFYLNSDTYHDNLVTMPMHETIPWWQGSGKTLSFDDVSKVSVTGLADVEEGDDITVNGVIAVLYDWDAMGVAMNRKSVRSMENPREEYINYFHKAAMMYYNAMSENGIVFYIADPPTPVPPPVNPPSGGE